MFLAMICHQGTSEVDHTTVHRLKKERVFLKQDGVIG